MAALMCGAPIAGRSTRPTIEEQANFLESTVPLTFGEWRKLDEPAQVIDPGTKQTLAKIYKEWLSRTYVNAAGDRIMLSMARSGNQIGIQQVFPTFLLSGPGLHQVGNIEDVELLTTYGTIPVTRLTAVMGARQGFICCTGRPRRIKGQDPGMF